MDKHVPASISAVAQDVLRLLSESRTGATATQLSGQMFLPKEQILGALRELAGRGYVRRHGRRWRV